MDNKLCLPGAVHTVGIPQGLVVWPRLGSRPVPALPAPQDPRFAFMPPWHRPGHRSPHWLGISGAKGNLIIAIRHVRRALLCAASGPASLLLSSPVQALGQSSHLQVEAEAQTWKLMAQSHTVGPQQGQPQIQVFPLRSGSGFIKAFSTPIDDGY